MKTKTYSNNVRKPMMYGGMAAPKKRKKMVGGGSAISDADKKAMADAAANADIQSRAATGRMSDKDKALMEKQRLEELGRMSISALRKIASGRLSDEDTMLARRVLRDKGDAGAMPSGDKEPTDGKAYGGMSKKTK